MGDEKLIFTFFNEVGIVSQLSQAYLQRHLPDGLHPSHFATLNHLYRVGDGRMPQAIAAAMQVTKGTMTHTLGVLESRGFIDIRLNPADGRSKMVYLTASGREFRDSVAHDLSGRLAAMLPLLDTQAMTNAIPALQMVRKVLDKEREGKLDAPGTGAADDDDVA